MKKLLIVLLLVLLHCSVCQTQMRQTFNGRLYGAGYYSYVNSSWSSWLLYLSRGGTMQFGVDHDGNLTCGTINGIDITTLAIANISDWPSGLSVTELGYLSTATSNVQEQLNAKAPASGIAQSAVTGLTDALGAKAPTASPTFTGGIAMAGGSDDNIKITFPGLKNADNFFTPSGIHLGTGGEVLAECNVSTSGNMVSPLYTGMSGYYIGTYSPEVTLKPTDGTGGPLRLEGAAAGDNPTDKRIQTFDFVGTWGAGDTFTVTIANSVALGIGTQSTEALAYNISNADLDTALEALFTAAWYGGPDITISGGPCPADTTATHALSTPWNVPTMTVAYETAGDGTVHVDRTPVYSGAGEFIIAGGLGVAGSPATINGGPVYIQGGLHNGAGVDGPVIIRQADGTTPIVNFGDATTGPAFTGPVTTNSTWDGVDVSTLPGKIVDVQKLFFTVYDDGDWLSEAVPIWQTPDGKAVTITKVRSAVIGATSPALAFNIEERPATALGSAGTDICSSEISADADGTVTTSFSNASIAADAYLVLTTAAAAVETGTVNLVCVSIYYTVN